MCCGSRATPCSTTACARSPTGSQVGIALLHLGGVRFPITGPVRYTMTARDAVELCGLVRPRTADPRPLRGVVALPAGPRRHRARVGQRAGRHQPELPFRSDRHWHRDRDVEAQRIGRSEKHPRAGICCWVAGSAGGPPSSADHRRSRRRAYPLRSLVAHPGRSTATAGRHTISSISPHARAVAASIGWPVRANPRCGGDRCDGAG